MKPFDKNYLSFQFKAKILLKSGTEFQTFFENIMGKAFSDFQKIRPYGNMGDGGNDGYRESSGVYYQVYAPNDPKTKDAEAAKKFQEDFQKLKNNWDNISKIKEYNFVLNDKYQGSIQLLEEVKTRLQGDYPHIDFKLFLAKKLEIIFFRLNQEDIIDLGFNIDQSLSISNAYDYLDNICTELDRENSNFAYKILKIINDSVLSLNDEILSLEYEILECRCLQKLEKNDEAISKYENLIKRYPEDQRAYLYLAEIFLNDDDINRNGDLLDEAEKIDAHFWLLKLEQLLRKNHLKEIIDISTIDEETFPENQIIKANFYRLYSLFYEEAGNETKAVSFIEKSIHLNPNRFSNYLVKLTLLENRMFLAQDISERILKAKELLEEIQKVEGKFNEFGDIGSRNKALLNVKKLNALWTQEKLSEFEKVAQKTFNILMSCYFNKPTQQMIAHILQFVLQPNSDLFKLLEHIKISNKNLIDDLSKQLISQLNIRNKLFTDGKEFFREIENKKFYDFIDEIDNENDEKVLQFLKSDTRFAIAIANTLKTKPGLRKKIIHSLPDEPNIQKEKLLLLLNFDENDYDEAFRILNKIDLSDLNYFECKPILHIIHKKQAWDFEIIVLKKLLEKETNKTEILNLKLQLFDSYLRLKKYVEAIDIGENLLRENVDNVFIGSMDKETLLNNIIFACFERGKIDKTVIKKSKEIVEEFKLAKPSFNFKAGIEAEVYLKNDEIENALKAVIEGLKIKKVLSPKEYAKLYFLLNIRIAGHLDLNLDSLESVENNTFVKLKNKKQWYFIGNDNELDAILISETNSKYKSFIGKKVGAWVSFDNQYSSENRKDLIDQIFSIEKYALWQTVQYFQELSKDGDIDGVQMIEMPHSDDALNPENLLKFLEDLHKRTEPFFKTYCENNIPISMLAVSEGGLTDAIGRIQNEDKGFIHFSNGTVEDFEKQKKVAKKIIVDKLPFYIDSTSALFLSEMGLFEKIHKYLPNLKVPQTVINLLADIGDKFGYTAGRKSQLGYANGQIFFSSIEKETRDRLQSTLIASIKLLELKPENVSVISSANKLDCFSEKNIPGELCDACILAQKESLPILTEDFLYLLINQFETKKDLPESFSSLALIRVLYEQGELEFDQYINYFSHLSFYRFRFLSLNSDDIEKAVFGEGGINKVNPENIRKFNFPLTLSEEYGVPFKKAFAVIGRFLFKVLMDNTVTPEISEKIFIEILESFPTKMNKNDFGQTLLRTIYQTIEDSKSNFILFPNNKLIQSKISKLQQITEIYSESKLWIPK